ncbi:MerC mercury resistance protein [Planctomycetes bacterium Poly30]|uniref:MerC mercury resistance protein n=1 Tax=Saltatorellus ferox TaxID=2528018 RepID=A0A518EL41_9BACT|nr:MerC mercury resistance protein [Planctomycetes bacterium Poly30]
MKNAPDSSEAACRRHAIADRLGVFAASACAVHCLAAPVVLALAPLAGSIWASRGTHWVFAAVSIPAALTLLRRRLHGRNRRGTMTLALAGSALILLGLAAPGAKWSQGRGVEMPIPSVWASQLETPSSHDCQHECCASVHSEGSDPATLFIPLASLVTMLGGGLLVAAHAMALLAGRRC